MKSSTVLMPSETRLVGEVLEVTVEGLTAKVVLAVGRQRITAIITADVVADLGLKPGDSAVAIFKPTHVMVGRRPSVH